MTTTNEVKTSPVRIVKKASVTKIKKAVKKTATRKVVSKKVATPRAKPLKNHTKVQSLVSEKTLRWLRTHAKKEGVSVAAFIRGCIDGYIVYKKEEAKAAKAAR